MSETEYTLISQPNINKLYCCDNFELWCFQNSSIGIFREYGTNTWCRCLDCCSTCLELHCNNCFSQSLVELCKNTHKEYIDDDCTILCCCISFILL
jgi:hypothetical protein